MPSTRYVALPKPSKKSTAVYLYRSDRSTKVRQVLWGDQLQVEQEMSGGWLKVHWAPNADDGGEMLYIRKSHTTEHRPLEIVFVDVGQGDGAVLIAPEPDGTERVSVIDAGERQNMHDFLLRRFGTYATSRQFHAAVITHPDKDHYQGFESIFADRRFGFDHLYHSGLVERPVAEAKQFDKLGGKTTDPDNGVEYVADLADGKTDFRRHFGPDVDIGDYQYPAVMREALANRKIKGYERVGREMTATRTEWLDECAPDDGRDYTVEVLGPVVESKHGEARLRRLGKPSETKNGHSIILKLTIGDFRILFGGDLNDRAERFLLQHYTQRDAFPSKGSQDYEDMVADASRTFRSDVMKACHHGSEKVTDAFLRAVNAAAFVVSSGEDGHIHPRPDLLGRLGTFGRGNRPVILSTELQRSTRAREDEETVTDLMADVKEAAEGPAQTPTDVEKLVERIERLGRTNVAVWGSIYVKTDGERLITAFKIETGSETKKWFYYEYAWDDEGLLSLVD